MTTNLRRRIALPLALLGALAAGAGVARADSKPEAATRPSFAGQWAFNAGQSDNANDKIREAQRNTRMAGRGPGGGYPRGGMGRGGIGVGYPGGGMGRGGMGRGGMGRGGAPQSAPINGEDLETLANDSKTLTIGQNQQQFSILDDAGNSRTLYADGKKHKEEDAAGQKITVKTRWDANRLVSEHKLGHTGKLTETYELSPDSKQLIFTSRLESSKLSGPLTIRRVYDNAAVHSP